MKNSYIIYGKHAVMSAINNPDREIVEIFLLKENNKLIEHKKVKILSNQEFNKLLPNIAHQGMAAMVQPVVDYSISHNILDKKAAKVMILDQVTDPQNLGNILRSAAAFNIDAVIYPKHGSASENAIVAKAASGGLDMVKLIEVVNINNIISDLKKSGFWVIGLDGTAKDNISSAQHLFESKIAIVMGSESVGIRPLVLKNCDMIIKLPINHQMESLNVSNAAAIIMWEMSKTSTQE